ncbi:hypothetical protein H3C61_01530 [Candidatus Gracilibacteria bacterium]|nr:hypothetical protein [Candidatus Gracilibacteria bacterium]
MIINNILEDEGILKYLEKRNLLEQYKKSKINVLKNINSGNYFKERKPKGSNIWYFRINKQFRAIGTIDKDGDLLIYKIDNHQ